MKQLLLVGLVSTCTLAAQPKPGTGSIEGHVFNSLSSAPIRKATVELTRSLTPRYIRLVADTDSAGGFQFTGLPPGTYRLSARRAGFLDRPLRRVISLGSDEHVADADIRLPPQSVISGRILDEEGEPEPGARVIVFKQVFQNGRKQWERLNNTFPANDLGEYRVTDLVSGRYILQAMVTREQPDNRYSDSDASRPRAFYYPVYYQSAATQREALPVDVGLGTEVRGIDIRLFKLVAPPSVHVRGKVVGLPPDSPVEVSVGLRAADEAPWWGGGSTIAKAPDYTFELTAPPGQYTIRANVYSGGPEAYGAQGLAVAGDVAGVALALRPAPVVPARIVLPEGARSVKLQGVTVNLHYPAGHTVWERQSDAGGKLALPNPMRPGRYTLSVDARSLPDGFFIQKVTLGDEEISEGDFEILASVPLELVLAKRAGRIAGSALDKDDKPCPVSTVTLIPTDSTLRPEKVSPDDTGAFNFSALRPGKYKLFAWEEVDDDLWQDPEFRTKYEDRATEVTVGPSETQNARVRVIAAEEMK